MGNYKTGSGNYRSRFLNFVTKVADETIQSSTSMQDDNDLFFPLSSDTRYSGYVSLVIDSASNADFHATFKVIANTVYSDFGPSTSSPSERKDFGSQVVPQTSGNDQTFILWFRVKTGSTVGTLQFQWGQGTSQASDTTVFEGSWLVVFEG